MKKTFLGLILFAVASVSMSVAAAENKNWTPDSTVKIIVPFGAGGTTDIIARIVGEQVSKKINQPVIVTNMGGAGGAIGTKAIVDAPANGLTLGFGTSSTIGTLPVVTKNPLPYDTEKDLRNVITVADTPRVMVVNNNVPAKTVKELVALTTSNPQKYFYGAILNSADYLHAETLRMQTKADITWVPYNNGADLVQALASNTVPMIFEALPSQLPMLRSGSTRLMAISWHERLAEFPNVPTWAELGYKDINHTAWYNLVVPAGTPDHIVNAWNKIFQAVLKDPAIQAELAKHVAYVKVNTPQEADKKAADQRAAYRKVLSQLDNTKR